MTSHHGQQSSHPSTLHSPSPGGHPPTATLATGLFVVTVPVLIILGVILHRRHRAAQLNRWIAHLEKSWKLVPQKPQR